MNVKNIDGKYELLEHAPYNEFLEFTVVHKGTNVHKHFSIVSTLTAEEYGKSKAMQVNHSILDIEAFLKSRQEKK